MEFVVSNNDNLGDGSLRWALDQANGNAGFDQISFDQSLSGQVIGLVTSLPSITDAVEISGLIDGSGAPQVQIDFNNQQGLIFAQGADRSSLVGFSLVDAGSDCIILNASKITIQDNYIGVDLDGFTTIANHGNGILVNSGSHDNLIGTLDELTGIPLEAQVSNVISGNIGDGIKIFKANNNRVANNRIGTTADGTGELGNTGNGISIASGSNRNIIGGDASGGNDPTKGVFVRPPQGNLISGNRLNGVLIDKGSTRNTLLGNFIGTDAEGTSSIGNVLDGVAIVNSDHNSLIGTTRNQSPFIYYNVVSGNGRNGLRVKNSDNITIHANFFGLGSDNATIVANGGNGALIEGDSKRTQYGGVIPLGNVNAGNGGNGIEVKDVVSGFITFNTFGGLTAFGGIAPNQGDGILITSSGGNNTVRTNVLSGNIGNGLHISGNAKGVSVDPNIIGLNTYGTAATYQVGADTISWGNGKNGILVDGSARRIVIAGNRRSLIPQNTISNNNEYGIFIGGSSSSVVIQNTYIGLSTNGLNEFGNQEGGIYVGSAVKSVQIGIREKSQSLPNKIVGNGGNGITLDGTDGALIEANKLDRNSGNGVLVANGTRNRIIANRANSNDLYGFKTIGRGRNTLRGNKGVNNKLGLYG